jgi:hypothetical protein
LADQKGLEFSVSNTVIKGTSGDEYLAVFDYPDVIRAITDNASPTAGGT